MEQNTSAGSSGDRIEGAQPRLEALEQSLRKALEALQELKPSPDREAPEMARESMPALEEIKSLREAARSPADWRALTERLGDIAKALGPEWRARGDLSSHLIEERELGAPVQGVAFSGGAPVVLVGDKISQPALWPVLGGSPVPLNISGVNCGALSADGRHAALAHLGSDCCKVLSFGPSGASEVGTIPMDRLGSTTVSFGPDGRSLAVISESSWRVKISLYSIPEVSRIAYMELASEHASIGPLAISPTGDRLAFSYSLRSPQETHRLRIVSLEHLAERNGRPRVIYDGVREAATALAYMPDGKLLCCDASGGVSLGSQVSGAVKPILSPKELAGTFQWEGLADLGTPATFVAVSSSGKTIAVATNDSFVRVLDTTERWEDGSIAIAAYYQFPHGRAIPTPKISALAISNNGKALVLGDSDGNVRVLGSESGD